MSDTAGIGHNEPPDEQKILMDKLELDHADLMRRKDSLLSSVHRAPRITDDEAAGTVSDVIKQLQSHHRKCEETRKAVKQPYVDAGRTVDGFFKKILGELADKTNMLRTSLTHYQQQKEAEERRRRQIEEQRAREAAEAAERAAREAEEAAQDDDDLDRAIAAEQAKLDAQREAAKAQLAASEKAAALSRTRGDMGAVSSLRTNWTGVLQDRAKLDLEALRPHLTDDCLTKAIRAWVRANKPAEGGPPPVLAGARVWDDKTSVVR